VAVPALSRVLLIEDDPDIQAIVSFALTRLAGLAVEVCGSGAEGLAAAARSAPDLILLDVMMPGMDGLATLARLREAPQTRSTPVVFLTAKVQPHEIEAYRKWGSVEVVAKPFEPSQLGETLGQIWRRLHGEAD
jgi:CheY-like chemotaxis protein